MSSSLSNTIDNSTNLRVIETLRSGVPGRNAVTVLGTNQEHITHAFEASLSRCADGESQEGLVIEGAFGTGKSHVLTHLRELALKANFAASIVCVSKEMTLASMNDLFAGAIRELRLPGKTVGGSCAEFLDHLNFETRAFAGILHHYTSSDDPVDAVFGATLQLFERYQRQPDVVDALIDFWDGAKCPIVDMKRDLKAVGLEYQHLHAPVESRLGLHRVQFVTNLLVAAGYCGWAILVDEGEMVAKLTLSTRAKAYCNMAVLLGCPQFANVSKVVSTIAITNDLWHVLLTERDDISKLDTRLRLSNPALAEAALHSIEYLRWPSHRFELRVSTPEELAELKERVGAIYRGAYPDSHPSTELTYFDGLDSRSIRSFLKEWITDWDLRRLYPGYEPDISEDVVRQDLSEDPEYDLDEELRL